MAITDYDPIAGNNTTISGTNIAEGCSPAGMNNAIRQVMADLADGAAVRAHLDLEPGTDVQAFDQALADIAGLTLAEGDLLYVNASNNLVKLPKGTADQHLRMNSSATAPEWVTVGVLGESQSYQDVSASRSASTSYQNTTGKPIMVNMRGRSGSSSNTRPIQVSDDNSTWIDIGDFPVSTSPRANISFVVPDTHYYRVNGSSDITYWAELR